jgi:hypothetical protein
VDSGDGAAARAFADQVRGLVERASEVVVGDRPLRDQSDDVRATLRITRAALARIEVMF